MRGAAWPTCRLRKPTAPAAACTPSLVSPRPTATTTAPHRRRKARQEHHDRPSSFGDRRWHRRDQQRSPRQTQCVRRRNGRGAVRHPGRAASAFRRAGSRVARRRCIVLLRSGRERHRRKHNGIDPPPTDGSRSSGHPTALRPGRADHRGVPWLDVGRIIPASVAVRHSYRRHRSTLQAARGWPRGHPRHGRRGQAVSNLRSGRGERPGAHRPGHGCRRGARPRDRVPSGLTRVPRRHRHGDGRAHCSGACRHRVDGPPGDRASGRAADSGVDGRRIDRPDLHQPVR